MAQQYHISTHHPFHQDIDFPVLVKRPVEPDDVRRVACGEARPRRAHTRDRSFYFIRQSQNDWPTPAWVATDKASARPPFPLRATQEGPVGKRTFVQDVQFALDLNPNLWFDV